MLTRKIVIYLHKNPDLWRKKELDVLLKLEEGWIDADTNVK